VARELKIGLKERLIKTVKELDGALSLESLEFKAAMTLMASCELGQEPLKIAEALGFDPRQVTLWCENMKAQGLWVDGKWGFSTDLDKGESVVEFWLHVLVAQGLVVCNPESTFSKPPAPKRVRKPRTKLTVDVKPQPRDAEESEPLGQAPKPHIEWCVDCYVAGRAATRADKEIEGDPLCLTCAKQRELITEPQ